MEEAAHILEEDSYFKVLATEKVAVDENEEQRIAQKREKQEKEKEEYRQKQANNPGAFPLPFLRTKVERSPYAYMVIARRCER